MILIWLSIERKDVPLLIKLTPANCILIFLSRLGLSRLQDEHTRAFHTLQTASRWLGFRLDFATFLFISTTVRRNTISTINRGPHASPNCLQPYVGGTSDARQFATDPNPLPVTQAFAAVAVRHTLDPGLVGLSLIMAIRLTGDFQWCVRQSAEIENCMTSVERVIEYSRLESEHDSRGDGDGGAFVAAAATTVTAPLKENRGEVQRITITGAKLPSQWPDAGSIILRDVSLRYDQSLPYSLRGCNLCLTAGETLGVVGRTGAGKSSLLAALYRLSPYITGVSVCGWVG
jgi:ABC-type multidrug transport system fused ATPase/permease subunit